MESLYSDWQRIHSWVVCVYVCMHVYSVMSDSLQPSDCTLPGSMGFSRQEHWSGCHFLLQGSLPDRGIKPTSPVSPALAGGFFTTEPLGKPVVRIEVDWEVDSGQVWATWAEEVVGVLVECCVTNDPRLCGGKIAIMLLCSQMLWVRKQYGT